MPPSDFADIHPIKTGKFTGEDLPPGPNRGGRLNESRFVRCRFCLSINDTELRAKGNGWAGNITYGTIPGTNLKDPTVGGAGCWFCGSSNGW